MKIDKLSSLNHTQENVILSIATIGCIEGFCDIIFRKHSPNVKSKIFSNVISHLQTKACQLNLTISLSWSISVHTRAFFKISIITIKSIEFIHLSPSYSLNYVKDKKKVFRSHIFVKLCLTSLLLLKINHIQDIGSKVILLVCCILFCTVTCLVCYSGCN